MINAAIIGATGYTGAELVRILARHPEVNLAILTSRKYAGMPISSVYPHLRGIADNICEELDCKKIADNCDVVFAALPHGTSGEILPQFVRAGIKVIDLSGDFRYKDVEIYEKWYGQRHPAPEFLGEAVYGLCEMHRDEIKNANLIGNPGCYTTCSILALAPLMGVVDKTSIIIDAKSGITGGGRTLAEPYLYCEAAENMAAYKIATHRHTSEIETELSYVAGGVITLSFTPHLVPLRRGILATCYANLNEWYTKDELLDAIKDFYKDEFFIRVLDELPQVKNVANTNFVDISLEVDERLKRVVVVACIDNLTKGAAGQAVQNMNIMFGMDERIGLV